MRTKHDLPLTLGHEISGHVIDTGANALWWIDRAVIVPAVIPCGHCDACQRGKATICPNQKMPGNDIHGGFATHIVVPAHGLCVVDEHRLAAAGIDLADLSVIADAVTTPYQAVVQAGVTAGDLVVVNGVGGVGGYAAQIAAAIGGIVVAIDVNDEKLEAIEGKGACAHFERQANDAARHQGGDPSLCQGTRPAPDRMDHFRVFGHPCRAGDRIQPAQSRAHARRRRLHHGQGRGAAVEPDGLSRAGDWKLGVPARALSRGALSLCSTVASRSTPFVEKHPLSEINQVFEAAHAGALKRRAVLVPASLKEYPIMSAEAARDIAATKSRSRKITIWSTNKAG